MTILQQAQKQAATGKPVFIRCDCYGRPLRIESHLTNGLGLIYKVERDGSYNRVWF